MAAPGIKGTFLQGKSHFPTESKGGHTATPSSLERFFWLLSGLGEPLASRKLNIHSELYPRAPRDVFIRACLCLASRNCSCLALSTHPKVVLVVTGIPGWHCPRAWALSAHREGSLWSTCQLEGSVSGLQIPRSLLAWLYYRPVWGQAIPGVLRPSAFRPERWVGIGGGCWRYVGECGSRFGMAAHQKRACQELNLYSGSPGNGEGQWPL